MAEREPEAIMPLVRGRGGRLGVEVMRDDGGHGGSRGGPSSVTYDQRQTIAPGAIVVVQHPGQSADDVALAVMSKLQTSPKFIEAIVNAGRA